MDMTDMTYDEGSMDVVIDKGALDALMSDDSGEYAHTYIHTYIHTCVHHNIIFTLISML